MCVNFLLVILSPSTLLFFPSPLSPPLTNWYDYFHSSLRLSVQIGIISRHSGLLLLSDVEDMIDLHAEQLADFSSISVGIKSFPSSAPSSRTIIYPSSLPPPPHSFINGQGSHTQAPTFSEFVDIFQRTHFVLPFLGDLSSELPLPDFDQ